jgi:hypothetical protein
VSARLRTALLVVVALALTCAGALGAAALHWYVVQPSDSELVRAARGIDQSALSPTSDPTVVGRWGPSFDRGMVVWDAAADRPVPGQEVADELEADGWDVDRIDVLGTSETVRATKAGLDVDVHLRVTGSAQTEATWRLTRGDPQPSLTVTVAAGAAVGLLAGLALGWAVQRESVSRRR